MKKLILLAIFLLFTKTAQAELVSWWKMDEASWSGAAGEVVDSYGSNHGTANGGTSCTTVVGIDNRAGSFDGSNDYVDAGNSASLNITNAITIEAWQKTTIADGWWVTKNWAGAGTPYMFGLNAGHGYRGFGFYDGSYHKTDISASGLTTLTNGNWHHVVGTYDGSVLRFYIDGVQDSYLNYVGSLPTDNINVLIGGALTSNVAYFNGSIDEVRIYNHALTADEVAHRYFLGSQTRLR